MIGPRAAGLISSPPHRMLTPAVQHSRALSSLNSSTVEQYGFPHHAAHPHIQACDPATRPTHSSHSCPRCPDHSDCSQACLPYISLFASASSCQQWPQPHQSHEQVRYDRPLPSSGRHRRSTSHAHPAHQSPSWSIRRMLRTRGFTLRECMHTPKTTCSAYHSGTLPNTPTGSDH